MRQLLLFILSFFISTGAAAQKQTVLETLTPDYLQLQFAGKIGLISGGFGYHLFNEKVQLSLLNGYTPASIAGSPINTLALRASYSICKVDLNKVHIVPYAGVGGNFETTGKAFYAKLPDRYADGYYFMSAAHATVFAGARLQIPVGKKEGQRLELYGETGTLDTYLYYYCKNSHIRLTEIFSGALGVSWHFGNR